MIVQMAAEGRPHFVITQRDHARMSGQLACAFGNSQFASLEPKPLMEYVVTHHDEGWEAVDSAPQLDAKTNLPYHLTQTPLSQLIVTSRRSPDFNEAFHPYCGLISSMHTWGLYHGRYGLSDKIFIDLITAEYKADAEKMLRDEIERQNRLKAALCTDATRARWVEDSVLFHNYKLLQFFDTLALYLQTVHEMALTEMTFMNVPLSIGRDTVITARRTGMGVVSLAPYPFTHDGLEVYTEGRYLHPLTTDRGDLGHHLQATPIERQSFKLVAA